MWLIVCPRSVYRQERRGADNYDTNTDATEDEDTPASYSGGPGFKSGRGEQLCLYFFVLFSVPPGECRDSTLKLDHDRFLSNHFENIVLVIENASLNSLQTKIQTTCEEV
jgi:hypothetical protein